MQTGSSSEAECAFCGRLVTHTRRVFCQGCASAHDVCPPCADAATADRELDVVLVG
jgi:hypothetical protein